MIYLILYIPIYYRSDTLLMNNISLQVVRQCSGNDSDLENPGNELSPITYLQTDKEVHIFHWDIFLD